VHPEILNYQNFPDPINMKIIWQERYEYIYDAEKHLASNGTIILKLWLNVSKQEQQNRFLNRLDDEDKYWKWSSSDMK